MRLLVKVRPGRAKTLAMAGVALELKQPLLPHIEAPKGRGLAAAAAWHIAEVKDSSAANAWDACHRLLDPGLGATGGVEFAEPDLEQRWISGERGDQALTLTKPCGVPEQQNSSYPIGPSERWFGEPGFSQLYAAAASVGDPGPGRLRIAHIDTGYDPLQAVKPKHISPTLQRNFVEGEPPNDATDRSDALIKALGHGTGTLGILAGTWNGQILGGAAELETVPIRVADFVVLFRNSAIAQAFDYVAGLAATPDRIDVVTLSMGGVPSQAWADAINALYEAGVFVVAAAGNNFGNMPTSAVVWPARFNRVVAACGAMADKSPYADLSRLRMAGNYGPETKMRTAMAAFTPNIPWARFGCPDTVDRDGGGTSSATPQVAAAAALWLEKHKAKILQYPQKWMRVEAARHALFSTAKPNGAESAKYFGRGLLRAADALAVAPQQAAALTREAADEVSFPILRLLFGGGIAAAPSSHQRLLEIEAAQIAARSQRMHELLTEAQWQGPPKTLTAAARAVLEALADDPGASRALRRALDGLGRGGRPGGGVSSGAGADTGGPPMPPPPPPATFAAMPESLAREIPAPAVRRLRVFAQDPLAGTKLDTLQLNQATLNVRWERDLAPGPVGEYLEVIDIDPTNNSVYAPVDLGHPHLLSTDGYAPSEGLPQFHQQMVYAVAMKTIGHFERALGRVSLWSARHLPPTTGGGGRRIYEQRFVRRLRIYPHALREANAYYSPTKKALLFGYFPAQLDGGANLPRGTVFTCLSHDIVAHETAHALLDGIHPRFTEASNADMLAFHEAFADIVALMQHFTMAESLKDAIRKTKGDLTRQSQLGALAWQFGQAIGERGALRNAIGTIGEDGKWRPHTPSPTDYEKAEESHERGAVLVAVVFDAFLQIYRYETRDLIRLATNGTGVLPQGDIPALLVDCLAVKAAQIAERILDICIRALDYCPPVDMNFGAYLRALVTADRDLYPEDTGAYRVAFIDAFRSRGIYPRDINSLSEESLVWEQSDRRIEGLERLVRELDFRWDLDASRFEAWAQARENARALHAWLTEDATDAELRLLGLVNRAKPPEMGEPGKFSRIEVHSVRPARRIASGRQLRVDLVVEVTQKWKPKDPATPLHRGGSTILIDAESGKLRYLVRKRVDHRGHMAQQREFKVALGLHGLHDTYFGSKAREAEPFAIAHRNL